MTEITLSEKAIEIKNALEQIEYYQEAISKKYIQVSEDYVYIQYFGITETKRRLNTKEELVQLEAFLKLIFDYNYSNKNIAVSQPVKIGSNTAEADIVVYNEEDTKPLIVVECKSSDVNEKVFQMAIEQAYSYAHAMAAKYVWITSGIKNEYFEIEKAFPVKRTTIPDIPKKNKEIPQYKYTKGDKENTPKEVTQDKLKQVFNSVHQALWGGGALSPTTAFDELDKLIFCKIWDERWLERNPETKGQPYNFQIITYPEDKKEGSNNKKAKEELSKRIKALYEKGRVMDPEVFKDDIKLNDDKIYTVVQYLQDINISKTNLDAKGAAFESFMHSFFRGDFGQFFTPRNIVNFIVESLEIDHKHKILDTSCGSGGFLLAALKEMRHKADKLYPNHETEAHEYNAWYKYWHDFAQSNLYGIEINEQISRVAKMNMIVHDDGHTNVITNDALKKAETIRTENNNNKFVDNSFDIILTNPPFGANVKANETTYFKSYELAQKNLGILNLKPRAKNEEENSAYRTNQKTEIMFFERCFNYLKEGGFLAIVVPDGILTNSSLQYVRDYIFEKYRIVSVVSLPQHTFTESGAGVKSSVLFLQKHPKKNISKLESALAEIQEKYKNTKDDKVEETIVKEYKDKVFKIISDYDVLMLEVDNIGYDATGKEIEGNELPEISKKIKSFIKEQRLI